MAPQGEQNVRPISDARFATADYDSCDHILSFKSGNYGRDRLVNYHLGCKVNLLRVHVRNSNKICDSATRCALKKFDLMGRVDFEPTTDVASWQYVGRFTMPDPGTTVRSPNHTTSKTNDPRTVLICHLRRSTSTRTGTGSRTRRSTSGS